MMDAEIGFCSDIPRCFSPTAVVVLAFLISVFLIKETVQLTEAEIEDEDHHDANLPFVEVLMRATYGDKTLFAAAQAGHINL